jgi:hypothetical protein
MNLKERIEKDYIIAYKEKNELSVSVLRMIKSSIKNAEINLRAELSDAEIIKTLRKEIKQRKESAAEYEKLNHKDRADKEEAEIKIIEKYLPKQLSETETKNIVDDTIRELDAHDLSQTGKVIGYIMGKYGDQVDGGMVAKFVRESLESV